MRPPQHSWCWSIRPYVHRSYPAALLVLRPSAAQPCRGQLLISFRVTCFSSLPNQPHHALESKKPTRAFHLNGKIDYATVRTTHKLVGTMPCKPAAPEIVAMCPEALGTTYMLRVRLLFMPLGAMLNVLHRAPKHSALPNENTIFAQAQR